MKKIYDCEGTYLGDGEVEEIHNDDVQPSDIDSYVVRFDDGIVGYFGKDEIRIEDIDDVQPVYDYYTFKAVGRDENLKYAMWFIGGCVVLAFIIYFYQLSHVH